jgi:hypothetical protein
MMRWMGVGSGEWGWEWEWGVDLRLKTCYLAIYPDKRQVVFTFLKVSSPPASLAGIHYSLVKE